VTVDPIGVPHPHWGEEVRVARWAPPPRLDRSARVVGHGLRKIAAWGHLGFRIALSLRGEVDSDR